ncbi:hypothetical protein AGMMS50268_27740 [Spirochaetia bacterium]|nr:hypothetical protein AGMMS50268_27740 [Spirochaetia bacterium]
MTLEELRAKRNRPVRKVKKSDFEEWKERFEKNEALYTTYRTEGIGGTIVIRRIKKEDTQHDQKK